MIKKDVRLGRRKRKQNGKKKKMMNGLRLGQKETLEKTHGDWCKAEIERDIGGNPW